MEVSSFITKKLIKEIVLDIVSINMKIWIFVKGYDLYINLVNSSYKTTNYKQDTDKLSFKNIPHHLSSREHRARRLRHHYWINFAFYSLSLSRSLALPLYSSYSRFKVYQLLGSKPSTRSTIPSAISYKYSPRNSLLSQAGDKLTSNMYGLQWLSRMISNPNT